MSKNNLNIAIFSPNQNPYSETFIQAHKNNLKGNIFYYYGSGNAILLEGKTRLMPSILHKAHKLYGKLFRKENTYLWKKRVLYSLKTNKIDSILVEYGDHAHHLKDVLKACKRPIIVHFHGYDASVGHVIEQCNYYKDVFLFASKVIAVSKTMYSKLLEMGCPKEKLVHNVYGPRPEFEAIIPTFAKKQFLAVGRFTDKKAPYYSILAFKEVLKKHPDAHLLMAGDGALFNTCQNLIKYYKLETNVNLLGVITPEAYRNLLKESLAFVQHSITATDGDMEGTPLAILEASAAGIPIISTWHAGIPDVIMDKKTGFLVNEHDVATMTKKMVLLLENKDLAKQIGMAGKNNINTSFSLKRHIDMLDDLMLNIAGNNK
jgi:colanic acid/amylovoran biosynthesis glycosyltransferase